MPQPLSSIISQLPKFEISFGPDCVRKEPELALRIASIVVRWATIEGALGTCLVKILGTNVEVGMAMYSVLRGASTQFQAIEAAAEQMLSKDDLEVFKATMVVVRSAQKQRNKIAHWIWGISPQVPDALLLIEPQHMHEKWAAIHERQRKPLHMTNVTSLDDIDEFFKPFRYDHDQIFVYKQQDFDQVIDGVTQADMAVATLRILLDRPLPETQHLPAAPLTIPIPRERLLKQLNEIPLFAKALEKIRKSG